MVLPRKFVVPSGGMTLEHHVVHVKSSVHYLLSDTFSVSFIDNAKLAESRHEGEIP